MQICLEIIEVNSYNTWEYFFYFLFNSLTVNPKTVAILLAISYLIPRFKDIVWQVINFSETELHAIYEIIC